MCPHSLCPFLLSYPPLCVMSPLLRSPSICPSLLSYPVQLSVPPLTLPISLCTPLSLCGPLSGLFPDVVVAVVVGLFHAPPLTLPSLRSHPRPPSLCPLAGLFIPDVVVAVVVGLGSALFFTPLAGALSRWLGRGPVLRVLTYSALLASFLMSHTFPYSPATPKRLLLCRAYATQGTPWDTHRTALQNRPTLLSCTRTTPKHLLLCWAYATQGTPEAQALPCPVGLALRPTLQGTATLLQSNTSLL